MHCIQELRYCMCCGCLYPVTQWKSSASILQGIKTVNRTGKEKVQITFQTVLTVLPREHASVRGKRLRYFPCFIFFSNSSSITLAHKRLGIWKRFYHRSTPYSIWVGFLCAFESTARYIVGRWDFLAPSYYVITAQINNFKVKTSSIYCWCTIMLSILILHACSENQSNCQMLGNDVWRVIHGDFVTVLTAPFFCTFTPSLYWLFILCNFHTFMQAAASQA